MSDLLRMNLQRAAEALELGSAKMQLRKGPDAQLSYEHDVGPRCQRYWQEEEYRAP